MTDKPERQPYKGRKRGRKEIPEAERNKVRAWSIEPDVLREMDALRADRRLRWRKKSRKKKFTLSAYVSKALRHQLRHTREAAERLLAKREQRLANKAGKGKVE